MSTAQKFFFSKFDQMLHFLQIWSHLQEITNGKLHFLSSANYGQHKHESLPGLAKNGYYRQHKPGILCTLMYLDFYGLIQVWNFMDFCIPKVKSDRYCPHHKPDCSAFEILSRAKCCFEVDESKFDQIGLTSSDNCVI